MVLVSCTNTTTSTASTAQAGTTAKAFSGSYTLTVYNPTGSYEVTSTFAPRVSDLNGKTICEVDDGIWQYDKSFPVITQLLQKEYPTAKIVTYDQLPDTSATPAKLVAAVKGAGCQAVIIGNAG